MINTFYLGAIITSSLEFVLGEYLSTPQQGTPQGEGGYEEGEPPIHIYPCTAFPDDLDIIYSQRWITFKRTSTTPSYTKDGLVCDKVEFMLNICCGSYSESTVLASYIREYFCNNVLRDSEELEDATSFLKHCRLEDASEDFEQDVYMQTLTFSGEVYYTEKKEQPTTKTED